MLRLRWSPRFVLAFGTIILARIPCPSTAAAQAPQLGRTAVWVAAAIGPTTPHALGIAAAVSARHRRLMVRGRYASSGEVAGDWLEDVGILVGGVVTPYSHRGLLSIGAGIGHARYRHYGTLAATPDPAPSTGFLLEAEGRLALSTHFGVTALVFGDINSTQSFAGLGVGLWFGKL